MIFTFCIFVPRASAGIIIHPPSYLGLQKGLVGCWTFDGASSYATDCSGNGNTGTLNGGVLQTAGKLGQAMSFDGSNDYVKVSSSPSLQSPSSEVSICARTFVPTSAGNQANYSVIALKDYATPRAFPYSTYGLLASNVANQHYSFVTSVSTTDNDILDSNVSIIKGSWVHVCGTMVGTAKKIYLNGVLANSNSSGVVPLAYSNGDFTIGTNSAVAEQFAGIIDDVRIFNRALSAAEIARIYKIGLGSKENRAEGGDQFDKGLVGHWTFDGKDISGTRAKDRSGNNNHGTLTLGPIQTLGKIGQGLRFDGTDDYVDVGNSSTLNPTAITVSAWVKPTSLPNAYNAIVQRGSGITYYEYFIKSTGKLALYLGSPNLAYDGTGTYTLSTGVWYHVVLTYDAIGGLNGYVNGKLDGHVAPSGNMGAVSANLFIAKDGVTAGRLMSGVVDDVRVYNRVLTAAEIKRLYDISQPKVNVTQTTLDKGLVGHWTFDGSDISGTRAKDRSGNNNHGTLTNGPVQTVGRIGQALKLNGLSDYVSTNLQNVGYNNGSVSWWMKPSRMFNDSTIHGFWGHITSLSVSPEFSAQKYSDNNLYIGFQGVAGGEDRVILAASATNYTQNVWQHYVFTWVSGGESLLYRNGVLIGTNGGGTTPYNIAVNWEIGRENLTDSTTFKGSMDDIRVYNRTLLAGEVNKLYQMGR